MMALDQIIDETFLGYFTNQQCITALRQRMTALTKPVGLTESQFETAYAECSEYIRRRVLSGYSTEILDDLSQDVWLRAWEKRHTFRGQSSVRTWLCNVARNVLIDYARRNTGLPLLSPLPMGEGDEAQEDEIATTPSEAPALDLRHDLAAILNPDDLKLLEMMESGESGKDMASALGITVKACESRTIRLRKRVQKYIQEGCRNEHA
jgi:RNA polymerase sigma-70 factor (ECF subfamily)